MTSESLDECKTTMGLALKGIWRLEVAIILQKSFRIRSSPTDQRPLATESNRHLSRRLSVPETILNQQRDHSQPTKTTHLDVMNAPWGSGITNEGPELPFGSQNADQAYQVRAPPYPKDVPKASDVGAL